MQIHALYAIKHGDVTMGRVAETLHCDASNVTGIVDRLVAGQFITRQEGELDRRTKTLQLTAKGHRAIDGHLLSPTRPARLRPPHRHRTLLPPRPRHQLIAEAPAGRTLR